MGICVRMAAKKRPAADVVVLDGSRGAPTVVEHFELTSAPGVLSKQIHDLAQGLSSRIAGLKPDRVAVRVADHAPIARNSDGPRVRLLAEGSLASAAVDACAKSAEVAVENGKDLAKRAGAANKEAHDSAAEALVAGKGKAAAAALSMLDP
jgi:hypothetical protein